MAENTPNVVPTLNYATPLDAPPSTQEAEGSPQPIAQESETPLAHMAFQHILLESLPDQTSLATVPGVVTATPAALTTPFYDAAAAGTTPDSAPGGLQRKLTDLINATPAYKKVGTNLAVALVDLSGANKFAPKYAGFNDLANFYGASVNKITGLLGVYQLLAEANELLRAQPTITDAAGLQSAFTTGWAQAGITAGHLPLDQSRQPKRVHPDSAVEVPVHRLDVAGARTVQPRQQGRPVDSTGIRPDLVSRAGPLTSELVGEGESAPRYRGAQHQRRLGRAVLHTGRAAPDDR
jgi:hypothetical protein